MKKYITVYILTIFLIFSLSTTVFANEINQEEITKIAESSSTNTVKDPTDSNYYLKSLTIEGYDMYPEFNKNTNQYYVSVPTSVSSLEINAEPEVDKASVKITGNSKLAKTENNITIDVTAKNKEIKRYTITVTKSNDNELKLENLEIEGAQLEPEFSTNKYFYKCNIKVTKEGDQLKPLNIKATPNVEDAKIEILGNNNITEGTNLITIMLKDGDEITTYQVEANVTSQTIVTSFEDTRTDFVKLVDRCKEEIEKWFEDENRKLATIIAGSSVGCVLIIVIIVRKIKKRKSRKNAEELKKRARK